MAEEWHKENHLYKEKGRGYGKGLGLSVVKESEHDIHALDKIRTYSKLTGPTRFPHTLS
jgi:hypothetical protein